LTHSSKAETLQHVAVPALVRAKLCAPCQDERGERESDERRSAAYHRAREAARPTWCVRGPQPPPAWALCGRLWYRIWSILA